MTAAGGRFLGEVQGSLARLRKAVVDAQAAGGRVAIGITSSIVSGFVRDLIAAWRTAHRDVAIELIEGAFTGHARALRKRDLDVTCQLGSVPHEGLDVEPLWVDRVFAAVPDDGTRGDRCARSLASFASELFIVSTRNSGSDIRDFLTTRLYRLGNSPSIRMVDVGREALLHCVGLGMGITITTAAGTAMRYPGVAFVEVLDERLPFSAIWSPGNDNPALRRLLSMARVRSRALGGELG